jgi:hypothetical protein
MYYPVTTVKPLAKVKETIVELSRTMLADQH